MFDLDETIYIKSAQNDLKPHFKLLNKMSNDGENK